MIHSNLVRVTTMVLNNYAVPRYALTAEQVEEIATKCVKEIETYTTPYNHVDAIQNELEKLLQPYEALL